MGYSYPVLTGEDVAEIADLCPHLQELYLPMKQQGGKLQGRKIYKKFGKFSHLQTFILETVYDPRILVHTQAADSHNSTLKEAFINTAIDKKLIGSVWDVVISNQHSKRLRNLRVLPVGTVYFRGFELSILQ